MRASSRAKQSPSELEIASGGGLDTAEERRLLDQRPRNDVRVEEILEMVLVGNSTMHHVLLNLQPKDLGLAPFVPTIHKSMDIKARELGIHINASGNIHVLPTIASFVMLHGQFTYENQNAWHTAERTVSVPSSEKSGNRSAGPH